MENRTWVKEGYTVEMVDFDYDLKQFEVRQGEEVQVITPATIEDMEMIIQDLDNGEDVDGWEDGNGGIITIKDFLTMEDLYNKIDKDFVADGTAGKYVMFVEKKEELDDMDGFDALKELDESVFPIITFDAMNGEFKIFSEKEYDLKRIYQEAEEYFRRRL